MYKFPTDKLSSNNRSQRKTKDATGKLSDVNFKLEVTSPLTNVDDIYNRYVVYLNLEELIKVVNTKSLIQNFSTYFALYDDILKENNKAFEKLNKNNT